MNRQGRTHWQSVLIASSFVLIDEPNVFFFMDCVVVVCAGIVG